MSLAALAMAGVSALSGLVGVIVIARRARSAQAVYARRIAGTMLLAMALILALFAWGLGQIGPG